MNQRSSLPNKYPFTDPDLINNHFLDNLPRPPSNESPNPAEFPAPTSENVEFHFKPINSFTLYNVVKKLNLQQQVMMEFQARC